MDNSNEYIAMCDCPEIQDGWKPRWRDLLLDNGKGNVWGRGGIVTITGELDGIFHVGRSQDQYTKKKHKNKRNVMVLDDKIENVVHQIWLQAKDSIIQKYGQKYYEKIKMEMKQIIKHEFF